MSEAMRKWGEACARLATAKADEQGAFCAVVRERDALLAPAAPVATVDPRRVVGAVVNDVDASCCLRIVVSSDPFQMKWLDGDDSWRPTQFDDRFRFVRWATPAECKAHGIPYVERTTPVERLAAGLPVETSVTPPASGARPTNYSPLAIKIVDALDNAGFIEKDDENLAFAYAEVDAVLPAPSPDGDAAERYPHPDSFAEGVRRIMRDEAFGFPWTWNDVRAEALDNFARAAKGAT